MRFLIMNGAGNRFAVFDAQDTPGFTLGTEKVKAICQPGSPVMGERGADQLVILRQPKSPDADIFMEIWNREGFEVDACGNATRTTAWLYMRDNDVDACIVQTNDTLLHCRLAGDMKVAVDMGPPKLDWTQIPLKEAMHTHHIDVKLGPIDNPVLSNPGAVSMGNPHCVFFVEDFTTVKPERAGPMIEFHPLFPEQANVGFAKVEARDRIRLKVWERGVGMTLACGTGACAAVVAAVRQKRTDRKVDVEVDGGLLQIEWRDADDHVIMTGPVELESEGVV
ncbi:diaminopimelate epimerase [Litorimonas sp. RW-G-Af-16]|uniref:diaminopimelate epimerase n=1 Tax=Litorimonas sp. RW-G-Af-16 TaxID=3241168 RepID=UPI00390C44BE